MIPDFALNFSKLLSKIDDGNITSVNFLTGGGTHKVWCVETENKKYAIKQINPHITQEEEFKKNYEISEKISNFFAKNGIPAISAIEIDNQFVHKLDHAWVILYPFVSGSLLELEQINAEKINNIGQIFSRLHSLKLSNFDDVKLQYDIFDNDHWKNLIKETSLSALSKLESTILLWNDRYRTSIPELNQDLLISHRDLHYQNVLWNEEDAWVVDWESAGLINPAMEIIGFSLEWSDILNGALNKNIFELLISSYIEHLKDKNIRFQESAFFGWLGHCALGWLEFNLRRRMGLISDDPYEINLGKQIIENKMIRCLSFLKEYEKEIITLCRRQFC